jgi:hypothetical protein
MFEAARVHEAAGRLNQALIELDAALEIAQQGDAAGQALHEEQRKHRQDLARRDAQDVLDRLVRRDGASFSVGDWLNLIARSRHDPDLKPLEAKILEQFREVVAKQADAELALARRSFESGQVVASLEACDRIAKLIAHLEADRAQTVRRDTEGLVTRLLQTHGVVVEPPRGQFVRGSEKSYTSSIMPVVVKALEANGYLPQRAGSPWTALWKHALYHLRMDVSERLEGGYLASENRVTQIQVHLALLARGVEKWQSIPTARTTVPLPNLPLYLASRLAANPARSEEMEHLLYNDARNQIDTKVSQTIRNIRPCCP